MQWRARTGRIGTVEALEHMGEGLAGDAHGGRQLDGIIVSNHGGRQLDGTLPTIAVLPEIVAAVDGRCEVYVDGGVRRGTDVLKALALGARAVLVGRPVIWGLAVGGEAGVKDVLRILQTELELAMRLAGRTSIQCVDGSLVSLGAPRMGAFSGARDVKRAVVRPRRRHSYNPAFAAVSAPRELAGSDR